MASPAPLARIEALAPYVPGMSIAEIRQKYGLENVIKLASNENPLGASPLAQEKIRRLAASVFRYPQGGNPRLVRTLARHHGTIAEKVVIGNGSDEIIDLLFRMLTESGKHNAVCFEPCFGLYPIQAHISGIETRRVPLEKDFSFNFDALLAKTDENTRLVFVTTPDNPSGYCPPLKEVRQFAATLAEKVPQALLVVDEAYMDFSSSERQYSMLANGIFPENVAFLRTFSKSLGLAGLRLGYGVFPEKLAECFWRIRLPFSVNILVEEAALAALDDSCFREATLKAVREGRQVLKEGLERLGCKVWPSAANFLLFALPQGSISARECFEKLLSQGIIIRTLGSYALPDHLRVSIGNGDENRTFLAAMENILGNGNIL